MSDMMTGLEASNLARRVGELTGGMAVVRERDGLYYVDLHAPAAGNRLGERVQTFECPEHFEVIYALVSRSYGAKP